MPNKNRKPSNRIPVRFVDSPETSEHGGDDGSAAPPTTQAAEETGSEATETSENEIFATLDPANEQDGASAPEDEASDGGVDAAPESTSAGDGSVETAASAQDLAYGPVMAELIATRSELRRVEAELKKLAAEKLDLTDKLSRRQADFENYRKRTERERTETYSRVVGDVIGRLLPVVDNLSRALAAEASVEAGESEEFRHFLRGIELIEKQLATLLTNLGVEAVPTVGEKFDPHVHEAVITVDTDDVEPDTVTEEMRRGYRLGNKLIRPAMVKVSK